MYNESKGRATDFFIVNNLTFYEADNGSERHTQYMYNGSKGRATEIFIVNTPTF